MRATDASRAVAVHETLAAAAAAAAREIVDVAREAVERRGRFVIALAGGETPRPLYTQLASEYRDALRWDRAEVCFGDERCVPPDDPASNYALVESTLLGHVPVAADRVHRIAGELGPDRAAPDYDARLRRVLSDDADGPTFDVALLGVGTDGHTASLFPRDSALAETERWAAPALAPPGTEVRERVTVTLPVLNRARVVLFLCAGSQKRDVVARILSGAAPQLPAARVYGVERTRWLLDRAAGG
ncbi:MAG: 6-phosphogluconolactonase [Gemmatimonadaceae bacterium]